MYKQTIKLARMILGGGILGSIYNLWAKLSHGKKLGLNLEGMGL
jgi:hypothetical protein